MACTQKIVPRLRLIDDVLPSSNTLHECWAGPNAFGETMPRHALLLNNTTKKTRMGHVFVPHFGEPCRSFILGNVSWYVDASGAALHVTWRVLEKRASEQNTVLIRQKNASPSSLRACAARPTLLSLPLSLFTIEEEPRERPHQHPREHCVRSDHSLAQLGFMHFMGQRACETMTRNPTESFRPSSFSGIIASPKKATKRISKLLPDIVSVRSMRFIP